MWPFTQIGNFLHSLFDKAGALLKKLWSLTLPFVKEVLSREGKIFWETSQDLILEALQYVNDKGLPTSEAKRKEFASCMENAAKDKWKALKESERDWMMQTGLLVLKNIISATISK